MVPRCIAELSSRCAGSRRQRRRRARRGTDGVASTRRRWHAPERGQHGFAIRSPCSIDSAIQRAASDWCSGSIPTSVESSVRPGFARASPSCATGSQLLVQARSCWPMTIILPRGRPAGRPPGQPTPRGRHHDPTTMIAGTSLSATFLQRQLRMIRTAMGRHPPGHCRDEERRCQHRPPNMRPLRWSPDRGPQGRSCGARSADVDDRRSSSRHCIGGWAL